MDSGASHNLMPKSIMDELGLEITKAYHDLYSFDSRKVKFLGVIKDMIATLFQFPMKSIVDEGASFHLSMRQQANTSVHIQEGREVPTLSFFL
jgi:hypothetical protein